MGHYCHICGRSRANEKFTGRGHRNHVCKDCQKMPREKRERIECMDELWNFLEQSHISDKNIQRLKTLVQHTDPEVRAFAALVLDIGKAYPYRRRRWTKMDGANLELFRRSQRVLGLETLDEVRFDYADESEAFGDETNAASQSPTPRRVDKDDDVPF